MLHLRLLVVALILLPTPAVAGERVPGERWSQFADVADAGFDAAKLAEARRTWEELPSSAFLVVADGAVVASWGETDRRFMCHSVRKSFMAGLYGIYWDRGQIELNKTLADLGIDDDPLPLMDTEKRARILDLLKARSGVFHPAAYAGRTDSRPRGSEGPGRFFAYNNWDFNTLATILMQETGCDVFEAFDEFFGRPLGMEDWRVSDGYYHYELDKSLYPAYPFRLSARDAARFGLLFARGGAWGGERVLSEHWVDRCRALYSIDNEINGYGFMWWVARQSPFLDHGMYSARGVGNQMIAVLPKSDLVIVNRANTYERERTPEGPLLDLIALVLEARTGEPVADPELVPLAVEVPVPVPALADASRLEEYVGEWSLPPEGIPASSRERGTFEVDGGRLRATMENRGTFHAYLVGDDEFFVEDMHRHFFAVRDEAGAVRGLAEASSIVGAGLTALGLGDTAGAARWMSIVEGVDTPHVRVGNALVAFLEGSARTARGLLEELVDDVGAEQVEERLNVIGYEFFVTEQFDVARQVFELVTEFWPESANAWDSLAEAHARLGNVDEAIAFYERSLELGNANAQAAIRALTEASAGR